MPTQHRYQALMLGGAIALAACGGGNDQPPAAAADRSPTSTSRVSACTLLTSEEIAEVTGTQAGQVTPDTFGNVGTCNYNMAGEMMPVVSIILAPNMTEVSSSEEMVAWRKSQIGNSYGDIKFIFTPIEGLGVPAIRNEIEGMGLVTVEAAAKGMLVDVTTESLEKSMALMPKALARLP